MERYDAVTRCLFRDKHYSLTSSEGNAHVIQRENWWVVQWVPPGQQAFIFPNCCFLCGQVNRPKEKPQARLTLGFQENYLLTTSWKQGHADQLVELEGRACRLWLPGPFLFVPTLLIPFMCFDSPLNFIASHLPNSSLGSSGNYLLAFVPWLLTGSFFVTVTQSLAQFQSTISVLQGHLLGHPGKLLCSIETEFQNNEMWNEDEVHF